MIVRKDIDINDALTSEEIDMLEKAQNLPVEFDSDSPELSEEELAQFRRVSDIRNSERRKQTVWLRLSSRALKKAKSLGKGYTSVLSRMLEAALSDNEMIKKYL